MRIQIVAEVDFDPEVSLAEVWALKRRAKEALARLAAENSEGEAVDPPLYEVGDLTVVVPRAKHLRAKPSRGTTRAR